MTSQGHFMYTYKYQLAKVLKRWKNALEVHVKLSALVCK